MKISVNILMILLCFVVGSQQQHIGFETDLVEEGEATVHVIDITLQEFLDTRDEFRSIVAVYSSTHCKKSSSHCEAEDKHIRARDVIITENTFWNGSDITRYVKVKLYIRDHMEPANPALTAKQLASVFYSYQDEIERDYGFMVEVDDPSQSTLEDWQIAVIVIMSVLLAGLIIFGIVFGYRQYSRNKLANEKDEDIGGLSSSNSVTQDDASHVYEPVKEQPSKESDYTGIETNADPVAQGMGDNNINMVDSDAVGSIDVIVGDSDTTNIIVDDDVDDNTAL